MHGCEIGRAVSFLPAASFEGQGSSVTGPGGDTRPAKLVGTLGNSGLDSDKEVVDSGEGLKGEYVRLAQSCPNLLDGLLPSRVNEKEVLLHWRFPPRSSGGVKPALRPQNI